jgi:hypothetical protein
MTWLLEPSSFLFQLHTKPSILMSCPTMLQNLFEYISLLMALEVITNAESFSLKEACEHSSLDAVQLKKLPTSYGFCDQFVQVGNDACQ